MKKAFFITLVFVAFISCKQEPTMQKYFVENAENKNFIVIDITPNILKLDKINLTATQKKALASFSKLNILAYKPTSKTKEELAKYETEKNKVQLLLKDIKYQELIKVGSGKDGASISFVGDENHINEFVIYGSKKENGFAVVRVLGKDMNPTDAMTFLSILKNSNIDIDQLKNLQEFIK